MRKRPNLSCFSLYRRVPAIVLTGSCKGCQMFQLKTIVHRFSNSCGEQTRAVSGSQFTQNSLMLGDAILYRDTSSISNSGTGAWEQWAERPHYAHSSDHDDRRGCRVIPVSSRQSPGPSQHSDGLCSLPTNKRPRYSKCFQQHAEAGGRTPFAQLRNAQLA